VDVRSLQPRQSHTHTPMQIHTQTHARARTHTDTHTHTHTHKHTHTHTHTCRPLEDTPLAWVDSPEALTDMVEELQGVGHLAVDLEHHHYRCVLLCPTNSWSV